MDEKEGQQALDLQRERNQRRTEGKPGYQSALTIA